MKKKSDNEQCKYAMTVRGGLVYRLATEITLHDEFCYRFFIIFLLLFPMMDVEFIQCHYFWEKGMNFRTRAFPII